MNISVEQALDQIIFDANDIQVKGEHEINRIIDICNLARAIKGCLKKPEPESPKTTE